MLTSVCPLTFGDKTAKGMGLKNLVFVLSPGTVWHRAQHGRRGRGSRELFFCEYRVDQLTSNVRDAVSPDAVGALGRMPQHWVKAP